MDKIATALPVNSTAAMVVRVGVHFEPKMKPHTVVTTDIMPRVWTGSHKNYDLTGTKFGRFVVMGLSVETAKRWVVRCQCGNYELRKSKAILNPANIDDRCHVCRATHYITEGRDMEKTRKEMMDECETLEDFQALGEKLGYKPGWAAHVFESKKIREAQQ